MGRRPETRVIWRSILHNHGDARSRTQSRILEVYDQWESLLSEEPDAFCEADGHCRAGSTLSSFLESIFEETSEHFDAYYTLYYKDLACAHIDIIAQSLEQAEHNIQTGHCQPRPDIPHAADTYRGDPIFTERAFVYVENLPKVVAALGSRKVRPSVEALTTLCPRCPRFMVDVDAAHAGGQFNLSFKFRTDTNCDFTRQWNMNIDIVHREGVTVPHPYYNDPSWVYIL